MKGLAKKVVIFLMVVFMQTGLFAALAEATPLYIDNTQQTVQLSRHDRQHNERRRIHDERLRRENERHAREMRRHKHESEHEWRERQRHEHERHDRELRIIAAILIGIAVANQ